MQRYIFKTLDSLSQNSQEQESGSKKVPKQEKGKDPFMLYATPHQPRSLFTKQDLDQSYKAGYIDAKSASLKELQQEAEFQKIESLKMIADYFPQMIHQNQENCKIFYQNILQMAQQIIAKLLPEDKLENAQQKIIETFKTLIDPLCQQDRLRIRLHPLMYEKVSESIKQIFDEKGSSMPLEFSTYDGLKVSECQVQWPEGMLVIDQTAFENNLQQLLSIDTLSTHIPQTTLSESATKNH